MRNLRQLIKKNIFIGSIGLIGYFSGLTINHVPYVLAAVIEDTDVAVQNPTLYPVPIETDDTIKYGYIDGFGTLVLEPVYDSANEFHDGYAVVFQGTKNKVIDTTGHVIFSCEGSIQDFHNGFAAFTDSSRNYKQGYINTKGKVVIKATYDYAGDFRADETALVLKGNKYIRIDSKGNSLKSYAAPKNTYSSNITEDGYLVTMDYDTFLFGVVDLTGKVVLKPNYGEITDLGNGLFGVKKKPTDDTLGLMAIQPSAIYDRKGNQLTPYKFYDLSTFHGDYASATDDTTTFFIDKTGHIQKDLPIVKGRGSLEQINSIIKADIDNECYYMQSDGTILWRKENSTTLPSGITITSIKTKPNKYVTVNYPKFSGMKDSKVQAAVNKKLKSLFLKYRKKIKVTDYMSVCDSFQAAQLQNVLVINRQGYDYPFGAAHGLPVRDYFFIDVNSGAFYQLSDLFLPNSNYTKKLSTLVEKQIKAQKDSDMYYFESKNLVDRNRTFYLTKDALVLYFGSGEITPYAAGFPEFKIPFKQIKSIIDTNGAFWKAIEGSDSVGA